MSTLVIPEKLVRAILFLRGQEDGSRWLADLPGILDHYSSVWGATFEVISDGGAMSACALGTQGGQGVVLKVPVDAQMGRSEGQLLDYWAPTGVVPAVIERDAETGVFLMERISPGDTQYPRSGVTDSERYGDLISRLCQPGLVNPPAVRTLGEVMDMRIGWCKERFEGDGYEGVSVLLPFALDMLGELQLSFDPSMSRMLHADLQAKNVLGRGGRYIAIDPMGAWGDLNAEVALWIAIQDGSTSILRRVEEMSSHHLLDPTRLAAWTYVLSIVEYRRHESVHAQRIEEYLSVVDPRLLMAELL